MNKSIELLIKICKTNRSEFSPNELAMLLNLKFIEGVYPYIRKLQEENLLVKQERGNYTLNNSSEKVRAIKFFINLFGDNTNLLLSIHTKNILQRFSKNPILKASDLPQHNLKMVKEIAKKTKIIYITQEGNKKIYFIRTWEDPVKKLLEFFDIKLQFDEEEFKHSVIKRYSTFTGRQLHLLNEKQIELAKLNMQYHFERKDFILDKLRNIEIPELTVINILTKAKLEKLTNPFEMTKKINEWKIKYVYNTDKIEGNALTFDEVKTLLTIGSEGIKREKKDILETENSKKALEGIFDTSNEISVEFVKKLHLITQQGIDLNAGNFKKEENCIVDSAGNLIDNTTPAQFVAERINELIKWYNENKEKLHPIILSSVFHNQFLYIHPFEDGNGRLGRLLLNFILIKHAFFPVIIFNDEKHKYYSVLRQSKNGDLKPFLSHITEIYRTQLEYF